MGVTSSQLPVNGGLRSLHLIRSARLHTRLLPERWYDTPNIHHVTVDDFRAFVKARGITVEGAWFLSGDQRTGSAMANLFAEHAVFLLRK